MTAEHKSWPARAYRRAYAGQDYLATKLALIFGFGWTIWVFFIIPLIAEFFPVNVQAKVFYYASGWVQLFALPLMVYVSNKIQATADKADVEQQRLLRDMDNVLTAVSATGAGNRDILTRVDALIQKNAENRTLIERNTELTDLVRQLAEQNAELTRDVRLAINGKLKLKQGKEGKAE